MMDAVVWSYCSLQVESIAGRRDAVVSGGDAQDPIEPIQSRGLEEVD